MLLKRQLGGTYLYPVHRLDRPTSGVLVFGKTREAAQGFGVLARERRVAKVYIAMVRGHADPAGAVLNLPVHHGASQSVFPTLSGVVDNDLDGAACSTSYETQAQCTIPLPVSKFDSARLSLLRVEPRTGHFHQIRRHLNRINRPIIGDTEHGDRPHNRWRDAVHTFH